MKDKELEQLRKIQHQTGEKIRKLLATKMLEDNGRFVGKYFKYRNSYSLPQTPDDYWWLYSHVVGISKDGMMEVTTFQNDKRGRIEIEMRACGTDATLGEEIDQSEYEEARDMLFEELTEAL